jgi:signal transduction histidine kinase
VTRLGVEAKGRRVGTAVRFSSFLGVLLLVVLAASTWATWSSFSSRTSAEAERNLTAVVEGYNSSIRGLASSQVDAATVRYLSETVLPSGEQLIVTLPGGRRYGTSAARDLLDVVAIKQLATEHPSGTTLSKASALGMPLEVLSVPIRQSGRVVGSVLATYELGSAQADQWRVLELALAEAAIALVAAVIGAYLLLRRVLGTVGHITTTARTIEEGDLDRRLGDQGTDDEVGELAATFDAMLDRIDEVMGLQRQLLSDVSHQLKTPLTVIRGHLEVLSRGALDDPVEIRATIELVVDEIDHMRELTEQLLLLGHSLEPDFIVVAPTDVRSLVGDLLAASSVLGDRRLETGEIADVVLLSDEAKLRGALLNLVDNAVQATKVGDTIRVSAVVDVSGTLTISVEDSGPGIPPAERTKVLARFGRPDTETRSGTGLGLAIAGAVAEAHGGRLEIGDSDLGGLAAMVIIPAPAVIAEPRLDPVAR